MPTQNPTVISASLDDSKLRNSIKSLVDFVQEQTKLMATSFDGSMSAIKKSMSDFPESVQRARQANRDLAESFESVSRAIRNAKSGGIGSYPAAGTGVFESEKKAIDEFNRKYKEAVDKAKAEQERLNQIAEMGRRSAEQSMRPRERWDVRQDSEINRLRMTIHGLELDLKRLDEIGLSRQRGEWRKLFDEQKAVEEQIKKYKQEQETLRKTPASNQFEQNAIIQQFDLLTQKIKEAEAQIKQLYEARQKILGTDFVGAERDSLTQKLQAAKNEVKQLGQAMIDAENAEKGLATTGQQVAAIQGRITDDVRKQAQAIRESEKFQQTGMFSVKSRVNGSDREYFVYANSKQSIEEQLVWIKQEEIKLEEQLHGATKKTAQQLQEEEYAARRAALAGQQMAQALQAAQQAQSSGSKPTRFQDFENLQAAIDHVNSASKKRVQIVNEETAAYYKMQPALRYMQEAYHRLSLDQRNSDMGKNLADQIQRTQRAMQQLQAQMSRPVSFKSAMGLDESTLENIAYKMRQLASYRSGLDVNKQAGEIKQVSNELDRLRKKQDELIGTNNRLTQSNNALSRSWNYMKNRLAFYFTVGASTQFVKNLIDIRSQYEMTERSIGILIDSAERGTQIFNELSQMALVSPYTLIELSNAAKQLVAYDIAAKDVVDTTRRLADMAAAVGIPMERLTYALGQIKSYGYLNARDNRMFANAGIPLTKQLADYYTQLEGRLVSTADVYDRIKKKAVGYTDVMSVINRMTDEGGKFFDFQAKMAGTLKVQLANLTLAWNNMLNDIGKSNQSLLTVPIAGLKELFLQWKNINRILTTLLITFGGLKATQLLVNVAFGKGTMSALKEAAAIESSTAATYENILSKTKLNASQAKFLIATNRSNVELRKAIVNMGALSVSEAKAAATTTGFRGIWMRMWTGSATVLTGAVRGIKAVGAAMWSLATNPVFIAMTALSAITDLFLQWRQNQEAIRELNNDIAKSASDAADSIHKFKKENTDFASAALGGGNVAEMEKAWEAIKEELESSALSVKYFMSELNSIPDAGERVKAAFDIANRIEQAQLALSKLDETAIQVNNDVAWGLFGEGLAEDLQDYAEKFNKFVATATTGFKNQAISSILKEDLDEAESEIEKFAQSAGRAIEVALGPDGIKDKVKVGEAIERIKQEMKLKNPEISGAAAQLFDVKLDQIFAKQFAGVYDNTTSLWNILMDEIKSKSSSAFQGITDDIYDENHAWSEDQKRAIDNAVEHLKATLPVEFHNVLDAMTRDLNSREFRIHIGYTFDAPKLDALTSDFNKRFLRGTGPLSNDEYSKRQQQYARFNRKDGETTLEWQKRLADERKKNNELLEQSTNIILKTTGVVKEQAEETKNTTAGIISTIDEIAKYEGFDVLGKTGGSKKTGKSGGKGSKPEDLVAKALKDELSLIKEMQSNYDKLRKAGVDATSALDIASSGYEETLKRINSVLTKYGISPFKASDFVGKDAVNPQSLLDALVNQRKTLLGSGKVKTASLKDLDVEIQKLNVEAKVYNMERVTKGLNSELDKLKDEYELSVELDANPELGNFLENMFDFDTTDFPKSIDEYMWNVQDAFEKAVDDLGLDEKGKYFDVFTASADDWKMWAESVGMSEEALNDFSAKFIESKGVAEKWARDIIKQTQDLEYKLADTNGKIAIEEKKLADLRKRLANEVNEEQQHLLELQIQDQENTIARLKDEAVATLSTYKNLFNSIVDHSARVTRKLAQQWKGALENAVKNADNTYTITDPNSGETSTVSEEKYNKLLGQVNSKLRETQSSFDKIREALTAGEDGLIDWVKAVELIADEAHKIADGIGEIANIADALGADEDVTEVINDIAASIDGLSTAAQGAAQIANGDIIGGTVNVVKGLWTTVSSWFDNSDKKITKKVKNSERAVKDLENAYKRLEYTVEHSMGAAETQARRAAIANKQLQLVELQRQLDLEKSRKKKNQDIDRIKELEGAVIVAKNDLENLKEDVMNTLLGSEIKSAAEDFVDTWVQAWREGETTLDAIAEKMDDMIFNLIKKAATSKIVGKLLQPLYDMVDQYTSKGSEGGVELTTNELKALAVLSDKLGIDINNALGVFYGNLENLDIVSKNIKDNELSALQQGIQGITEDTASALEAYMNSISQQVYLHSDLLMQIRDAVVAMDGDIQLSTQAQMLLQLQNSYILMQSMHSMMNGWTIPSGAGIRVELIN